VKQIFYYADKDVVQKLSSL